MKSALKNLFKNSNIKKQQKRKYKQKKNFLTENIKQEHRTEVQYLPKVWCTFFFLRNSADIKFDFVVVYI